MKRGAWMVILSTLFMLGRLVWVETLTVRYETVPQLTRSHVLSEIRILLSSLQLTARTLHGLLQILVRGELSLSDSYASACRQWGVAGLRRLLDFVKDRSAYERQLMLPSECFNRALDLHEVRDELLATGYVTHLHPHSDLKDWQVVLGAKDRPLVDRWCEYIDEASLTEELLNSINLLDLLGPSCIRHFSNQAPEIIDKAIASVATEADEVSIVRFTQSLIESDWVFPIEALHRQLQWRPSPSPLISLLLSLLGETCPPLDVLYEWFCQAIGSYAAHPQQLVEIVRLWLVLYRLRFSNVSFDPRTLPAVDFGSPRLPLAPLQRLGIALGRIVDYSTARRTANSLNMGLDYILQSIVPNYWRDHLGDLMGKMPLTWRLAYYQRYEASPNSYRVTDLPNLDAFPFITPYYYFVGVSAECVRDRFNQHIRDEEDWLIAPSAGPSTMDIDRVMPPTFRPRLWISGGWEQVLRLSLYFLVHHRQSLGYLDYAFCKVLYQRDQDGMAKYVQEDLQYRPERGMVMGENVYHIAETLKKVYVATGVELILPKQSICELLSVPLSTE